MENPQTHLSEMETDAIGEIQNISMGSAATAMSTLLDRKVDITTPKVSVKPLKEIDYTSLEPAMLVKITYIEGITGCSVMVFRQRDMQLLLNQLMGNTDLPQPDFEFDELSISAACEVMNQMMGASATALSEFLGKSINISTPEAHVIENDYTFRDAMEVDNDDDEIVSIRFQLTIDEIMDSEFINVMSISLAKSLVSQFVGSSKEEPEVQQPQPSQQQQQVPQPQVPPQQQMHPAQQQQYAPQPGQGYYPENPYYPQPPMYGGYPPMGYPMYPNNPVPPAMASNAAAEKPPVNVQNLQVPHFSAQNPVLAAPIPGGNMDLIMNVPLGVSVEIGKTKRKVKDILEFTQGTVIELEKQAGAPVDIIVNGQLIARGDVVVIEDNFGVRITEILNTKEIIGGNEQN